MSKPNRRKEIKEKEELQAKFQLAISQTNTRVLSWLQPLQKPAGDAPQDGQKSFLDLPIIANGTGLYSLKEGANEQRLVGDFLANGTGNRPSAPNETPVRKEAGSKAIHALMNKMRNSSKQKIRQNIIDRENSGRPKSHNRGARPGTGVHTDAAAAGRSQLPLADEDDEDGAARHANRAVKKGTNSLFAGKVGKKKGRPF